MGAINVKHTGSGAAIALSSDGTSLLLDGTAIGGGASALTIDAKTTAYTVVPGDLGKVINCTTGPFTVTLSAAATLGAGFYFYLWNTSNSSTQIITIDPYLSQTINGTSTAKLIRNQAVKIVCDGSNFRTQEMLNSPFNANFSSANMNNVATGDSSIAIGDTVTASATFGIAVGRSATASNTYAMALGSSSSAVGNRSTAIQDSYSSGQDSFAANIGNNSTTYGAQNSGSIALGILAKATGDGSYAIGEGSQSTAADSYAFGLGARATGTQATALGPSADATAIWSVAIGRNSDATAQRAFSIGYGSTADQSDSYAFGFNAYSGVAAQIAIGGPTNTVKISTLHETVGTITTGTIDLATGNVFADAPAANATYVFSNPAASGLANGFTLKITPSATVTITWPASVDWAAATAPDAPASGATNVYTFYTTDGGTTYYGFLAGGAMG